MLGRVRPVHGNDNNYDNGSRVTETGSPTFNHLAQKRLLRFTFVAFDNNTHMHKSVFCTQRAARFTHTEVFVKRFRLQNTLTEGTLNLRILFTAHCEAGTEAVHYLLEQSESFQRVLHSFCCHPVSLYFIPISFCGKAASPCGERTSNRWRMQNSDNRGGKAKSMTLCWVYALGGVNVSLLSPEFTPMAILFSRHSCLVWTATAPRSLHHWSQLVIMRSSYPSEGQTISPSPHTQLHSLLAKGADLGWDPEVTCLGGRLNLGSSTLPRGSRFTVSAASSHWLRARTPEPAPCRFTVSAAASHWLRIDPQWLFVADDQCWDLELHHLLLQMFLVKASLCLNICTSAPESCTTKILSFCQRNFFRPFLKGLKKSFFKVFVIFLTFSDQNFWSTDNW